MSERHDGACLLLWLRGFAVRVTKRTSSGIARSASDSSSFASIRGCCLLLLNGCITWHGRPGHVLWTTFLTGETQVPRDWRCALGPGYLVAGLSGRQISVAPRIRKEKGDLSCMRQRNSFWPGAVIAASGRQPRKNPSNRGARRVSGLGYGSGPGYAGQMPGDSAVVTIRGREERTAARFAS